MTAPRKPSRREVLALTLARGGTITLAAKQSGYSRRQVHRLMNDPAFADRVAAIRQQLVDRLVGRMGAYSVAAAKTLHDLLSDKSATVRATAAKSLIELSARLRSEATHTAALAKLDARLARLEGVRLHKGTGA